MSRVLLAAAADRDAIDRFALAEDLSLVQVLAQRHDRPHQITFSTSDGALVTFIDDHRIAARYAVVQGLDIDPLIARIEAGLPHVTIAQLMTLLDDAKNRVRAIAWLGVIAPQFPDENVAPVLRAARASDDPNERAAAEFAWEAAGWSDAP